MDSSVSSNVIDVSVKNEEAFSLRGHEREFKTLSTPYAARK